VTQNGGSDIIDSLMAGGLAVVLAAALLSFDETTLVPNAGLLPAAVLVERLGLAELVDQRLHLARHGANSGTKARARSGRCWRAGTASTTSAVWPGSRLTLQLPTSPDQRLQGLWLPPALDCTSSIRSNNSFVRRCSVSSSCRSATVCAAESVCRAMLALSPPKTDRPRAFIGRSVVDARFLIGHSLSRSRGTRV